MSFTCQLPHYISLLGDCDATYLDITSKQLTGSRRGQGKVIRHLAASARLAQVPVPDGR
jgi:hypothetical protein